MKRNEIIYTDAETFTPEEESITAENSTFASAAKEHGKTKKSANKTTLTVIICLLAAAAVMIAGYFIFLYEPETAVEVDAFYIPSPEAIKYLDSTEAVIHFKNSEDILESDKTYSIVYKYVLQCVEAEGLNITVKTSSGDAFCTVEANGKTKKFDTMEFFRTLDDGTVFAFDGESMLTNAILSLYEKEAVELPLRALAGYDTDGDTVSSTGYPLMYPQIQRTDIKSLTIKNTASEYTIYRPDTSKSTFYIKGAEGVELGAEVFAKTVTDAAYTLTVGKIPNPKDFATYGLDGGGKTATVTIETVTGVIHKLIIGDKHPSGGYYYARYDGKPFVYLLAIDNVEPSFTAGGEKLLTPTLVYSIQDNNEIYTIDRMAIHFRDLDTTLAIRLRTTFEFDSNTFKSKEDSDPATMLGDLKRGSGKYSDWTADANFIGLGTTNSKDLRMVISLNRYSDNGKYSVKLPLVRDENKGAYLPESIKLRILTKDAEDWEYVSFTGGETIQTQQNGTYYQHVLYFESEEPVVSVGLDFEGYDKTELLVTDEIRVMAGNVDANPADAFVGNWKITTEGLIPEGKNYAYVNSINYPEFLSSVCTLVADEVVKFGIQDMDLAEYGLGKGEDGSGKDPALQIHYEYKVEGGKYVMDILFSDPDKDGSRYVVSMVTFVDNSGEESMALNPYIARISTETAPWLEWDLLDFTSSSLMYMYIDDIDEIKFTYDGKAYNFVLGEDENGKVVTAALDGKEVNMDDFRMCYQALINVNRTGEYDGEDTGSEMFRVNIVSETKTDEIIFYRISSTRAYYTINGEGGFYTLTYDVSETISRLEKVLAGE